MADYYLNGEEKFGPVMSRLYAAGSKAGPAKKIYGFLIDDITSAGAARILDVGTGNGTVPIRLARASKRSVVYAVDPSRDMIGIARRDSAGIGNIRFALGSSRHVPFRAKFEIIFSCLSFHHWQRKEESLRYLASRLAKGGEIRIYEYNKGKAGFLKNTLMYGHLLSLPEMRAVVKASGLRISGILEKGALVRVSIRRGLSRIPS